MISELRGIKAAGTVGLSKTTLDKMPNFRVLRLQGSCLLRGMPLSSQGTRCLGLASDFDTFQAGIKIVGENINNLRYADDTTLMAESEEELKSLLMKVKEESEKVGLNKTQHSEN